MTLGGYGAFDDPYVYKGTVVLKNRLGTRDQAVLDAFEVEMSTLRSEEPLPSGKFDAVHYRKVHRHLFQDVYSWAGRYRTVRISKGGHVFCYPEHIANSMERLFANLKAQAYLRVESSDAFIHGAAEFLAELNAVHAFRDGNGRAQLAFLHLLANEAGHPLRLERIKRDTFLPAMVASFDGDLLPLIRALTELRP